MCEQLNLSLVILHFGGDELLVLTLSRSAKRLAILAFLGLVLLDIPCIGFIPCSLSLLEFSLCLLGFGNGSPLDFHAHLLKSIAGKLHDMEAVNDYLCIWEHLLGVAHNAVGEVHRHFFDS